MNKLRRKELGQVINGLNTIQDRDDLYSLINTLDNIKYDEVEELDVSKWDVDKKGTIVAKIPDNLKNAGYIFARIGVRSTSSSEYIFTPVAKIEL